ncbi:MAG: hypothetical protein C0506_17495, partial [Anaerolinea sp.]|nr:hypothetical protein [Anaerolinea sp.]
MKTFAQRLLRGIFLITLSATSSWSVAAEPVAVAKDEKDRCIALLRGGLASEEFWPAMHAAEALTLAEEGESVVKGLRPRLPLETNDQRRCGLARELVRA